MMVWSELCASFSATPETEKEGTIPMQSTSATSDLCLKVSTKSLGQLRLFTMGRWCFAFGRIRETECTVEAVSSSMVTTLAGTQAVAASSLPARRGKRSKSSTSAASASPVSRQTPVIPDRGSIGVDQASLDLVPSGTAEPLPTEAPIIVQDDGFVVDGATGEVLGHVSDPVPAAR